MADTLDYIFWDFRHLLGRPLGWGLLPLLNPGYLPRRAMNLAAPFLILNCVAGLFFSIPPSRHPAPLLLSIMGSGVLPRPLYPLPPGPISMRGS